MFKKFKLYNMQNMFLYIFLTVFTILTSIYVIYIHEYFSIIFCVSTLVIFYLIKKSCTKYTIHLPVVLEAIIIILIFSGEILGEVYHFYTLIPIWDCILHMIYGFILTGIGLFILLNRLSSDICCPDKLKGIICIFTFCFSITICSIWEIFEFASDQIFKNDMQKDNVITEIASYMLRNASKKDKPIKISNIYMSKIYYFDSNNMPQEEVIYNGYIDIGIKDTISDLIVAIIGSLIYIFFAYNYLKQPEKYIKFYKCFIIQKEET